MLQRSDLLCLVLLTLLSAAVPATAAEPSVTMEQIMADPAWIGATPTGSYWSVDGSQIYFQRPRPQENDFDLYRLSIDGADAEEIAAEVLIEGAAWAEIDTQRQEFSADRSWAVFDRNGDIFLRRVSDGRLQQLTRTAERESSPFFMAEGRAVAFLRAGDFFVRDLETGLESQAADIRTGEDPDDEKEKDDYLTEQQTRLFEVVRDRAARRDKSRDLKEARRQADPTRAPKAVYLGKKIDILYSRLSPAGDAVALVTAPEGRKRGRQDNMPVWVTADGYVEIQETRPKVGTADDPDHALVLVDVDGAEAHTFDLSNLPTILDDPLADLKAARDAEKAGDKDAAASQPEVEQGKKAKKVKKVKGKKAEKGKKDKTDGDGDSETAKKEPRSVEIERIVWSPDGSQAAVQLHSYDNKDRWIALASLPKAEDKADAQDGDAQDGDAEEEAPQLKPIHHLHIEGWINWSFNGMDWLDGHRLWFLSEESGWSQLYLYDTRDGSTRRLTEGDAVVSNPTPSPDRRYLYFTANPEHPGVYDTYRVEIESGQTEQVSSLGGQTSYVLSPDGEQLVLSHSSLLRPAELYLQDAAPGAEARRLTDSLTDEFKAVDWVEPEIVAVPSSHVERPIYSRFYPARHPDRLRGADGKVPVVVFVHGAGYLQNAHKGWSGYFREFMFHTLLAEHGYHVLDMDYRASKGYGVAWRTAIYRQMGTPELEDLQDGVAWLIAEHDADPARAGVYGGSYGGFMTMMALFKDPDLFAAGAALRPVTDWAHYNHPYTSNILNTPDVDPEAYARSSPIEFADGLKNPLLICAPMLDDNVFFLDTVRLTQKFIELGITSFEVAPYPVEPHGFRQPSSWLDEYRRIFRLFEQNLTP